MLYDERWGKETKVRIRMEPWQVILLLAADELETNGWCQGDYYQHRQYKPGWVTTAHCALGAIRTVGGSMVERYEAEVHLADHIKLPVAYWNDHWVRTKEEVIAKLREVANAGN